MTFADDSLAVARSLGRLLADGSTELEEPAFHVVLVARGATLDLARMLHRDVVGPRAQGLGVTIADLEVSPVLTLGRLMARPARIQASVSPTDALAGPHTGIAVEWAMLARAAISAMDHWPSGHGAVLQPDEAWSVIADTAAILEANTVLDGDLSAAADRLGHGDLAGQLMASHRSGLRSAAAAVRSQAVSGPLGEQPLVVARPEALRVVIVRDVESAVQAQRNMGRLLEQARHVRPQHAAQIAIAYARVARALGGGLRGRGADDESLAARVNALVGPLARVASRPGRVASLDAGDPRPLQQASELVRFVSGNLDQLSAARPDQLVAWAGHLATAVQGLADRASRELDRSQWLVPDVCDDAATMWCSHVAGAEAPVLLAAAREAANLASTIPVAEAPQAVQAHVRPSTVSVHRRLAPALEARRPSRPQLPGCVAVPTRRR